MHLLKEIDSGLTIAGNNISGQANFRFIILPLSLTPRGKFASFKEAFALSNLELTVRVKKYFFTSQDHPFNVSLLRYTVRLRYERRNSTEH